MRIITLLAIPALIFHAEKAGAQGLAVNASGAAADASAILDAASTTRGILIPRMTAANKAAITAPATGLMIYQTDGTTGFYYYNGSAWSMVGSPPSGAAGGDLTGSYPNPTIASTAGANIVTAVNASSSTINAARLQNTVTTQGNTFNGFSQLVQLDGGGRLPAVDGSQLTNLPAWDYNGNSVSGSPLLGTTNNNFFDIISNNIARGRVDLTGRLYWGTTTPSGTTSLVNVVTSTTYPDAVAANTSGNGSAFWGTTLAAASTNISTIEGDYYGSGIGSGVLGEYAGTNTSTTAMGVLGRYNNSATNTSGGIGVYGYNARTTGNARVGVYGTYNTSAYGAGMVAIGFGGTTLPATNADYGIYASAGTGTGSYAGYFQGNHVITGTKSASVPTSKGNQLLYVTETPGVWFEDIGEGQLVNGKATIDVDPLFLETVQIDAKHPMHVFIQVQGDCNDVYVVPGTTGFRVVEKNSGTSNVTFSYRVMAKRLHYADHRFGSDLTWGDEDTRKYAQDIPPRPIDYKEAAAKAESEKRNPAPGRYPPHFRMPEPPPAVSRTGKNGQTGNASGKQD